MRDARNNLPIYNAFQCTLPTGHTDKEVPERSDEDKQVDEDIDAEGTDTDAYSDEEGADLTNEEWRMLRAQEPEIQDDNEDEDYNDHNN